MGHVWIIRGKVVRGELVGRNLGFPTINVLGRHDLPQGVYVSLVTTSRGTYKGALHHGPRHVLGIDYPSLEVHLLDFEGDLYDETVEIAVYNKIRDVQAFDDLKSLKAQIEKDVEQVALADISYDPYARLSSQ